MEPRLIKGLQAEFVPTVYPGSNTSGLTVYGKNVLVAVDVCAQVSGGGVMLPMDMQEQMTESAETGAIFALGPEAFHLFEDGHRWTGARPEVGDRIYFEKYAGLLARGRDGLIYRVMDYRAIAAGLEKDGEEDPALALPPTEQQACPPSRKLLKTS